MELGQGPNWGCSAKEKKMKFQSPFQILFWLVEAEYISYYLAQSHNTNLF
jgi:hypothetical protein